MIRCCKIFILTLVAISCNKPTVYTPVGGKLQNKDLEISKHRVKNLNASERTYIQQWISASKKQYYPTSLNYWSDIKDLDKRTKKKDGVVISYTYYLNDLAGNKVYEEPINISEITLGKYKDLVAVEDALRYLNAGETAELLVPSSLAYGTYGDEKQIPHDFPLVIQVKLNSIR